MSRPQANLLLLLVALIWGTTFVAQQIVMKDIGPFVYTGIRFLLGALVVLPMAWREFDRLRGRGVAIGRRDLLLWGCLGVLLFGGAVLQQIGIAGTSVSNAGFFTALYMPMVPLLAWALHRQRPHSSLWPAIAGSLAGTFLLSGGELSALAEGDFWVLASTLFWAAHVLYVGRVAAQKGAPILVACAQFVTCGVLSLLWGGISEPFNAEGIASGLPAILYGGVLSVGVGFTLQVVAQRHTRAADAAVLLSAETVFAGVAGALFLDERLGAMQLTGCLLILASILAVQLLPLWQAGKRLPGGA